MTSQQVLQWIKKELSEIIIKAISDSKTTHFTESLLAAIPCREVGNIIAKYAPNMPMMDISSLTRGDFTQRPNDKEKCYHGFSMYQIDIDSFPSFVKSGAWKDPYKACLMAISILEGKRKYIASKCPNLTRNELMQATIAAYNCGEGNVVKTINAKQDIDSKTTGGDYSKCVLAYQKMYEGQ